MTLERVSHLFILTPYGERKIQLHVGDITKLPPDEKVDIMLLSNQPDYDHIREALSSNLDLDITRLFSNIKEDLRDTHSCWTSQILSDKCPYRQLLCFEEVDHDTESSVDAYLSPLMQIFHNENHSLIMPLVVPEEEDLELRTYLECLLHCASKWMAFGLPLQCLHIVIPDLSLSQPSQETKMCIDRFQQMAENFHGICPLPTEPPIQNDVLLIFCTKDINLAEYVRGTLMTQRPDLRVKIASQTEDQVKVMSSSKRIVPLLTKGFLGNQSCLNLFNLALSCNRRIKRRLIAPFKMDFHLDLPAYMDIFQWISCTVQNDNKMQRACSQLLLEVTVREPALPESVVPAKGFDVFLSYSHKDVKMARHVLRLMQQHNPKIKVFLDYDELKTGSLWQQVLYKAVDQSRTMLALVCPEYLESSVCMEEFNMGLAKHLERDPTMKLVPLVIRPVNTQLFMDHVICIQQQEGILADAITKACHSIQDFLCTGSEVQQAPVVENVVDVDVLSEEQRKHDFQQSYLLDSDDDELILQRKHSKVSPTVTILHSTVARKSCFNIYMSYIASEQRYADFVQKRMMQIDCGLGRPVRFFNSLSCNGAVAIERADLAIAFLSHNYLASPKDLEEFHYILSRARTKPRQFLYPIVIDQLPVMPLYARLIPTHCHLKDDLWAKMALDRDLTIRDNLLLDQVSHQHGTLEDTEVMALIKGTCDLQAIIKGSRNYSSYASQSGLMNSMAHMYTELYGRPLSSQSWFPPTNEVAEGQ